MTPSDSPAYERGDALDTVLGPETSTDGSSAAPGRMVERGEVYDFSEDEYWAWLFALMEDGRDLNDYLDTLLDQVYACDPPFYSLEGQRTLKALLNELNEARQNVRDYEHDVEELTYVFSRVDRIESQASNGADLALASVKDTYNRAYDLCLYKLDRMSNGWITATNLLISLTILVVTILFWMEFR